MTRQSDFTCRTGITIYAHQLLYRSVFAFFFLYIFFFAAPAYAEERKVFTDVDLEKYSARPMVDDETISRSEADLNSYLNKRSAELQRDEKTRRQSEEAKRLTNQKKQATAELQSKSMVSQVPVTVQRTPRRS